MLVQNFLEANVQRRPDKIALIFGASAYSYAQLDSMANRLAHALRDRGIRRGERVVIYLDNRPETVAAIFAVLKADAVFVVVNRSTKERKLAYIARNCGAAAMITDARAITSSPDLVREIFPSLKALVVTDCRASRKGGQATTYCPWEELQEVFPSECPKAANIDLDLAALIYTSGTTGEPKGVMADHAAMAFASGAVVEYLGNHERDVVLNALPLSFNYGLYHVLTMFRCGGTVLLENSFAFPSQILKRIGEHGVTGFPGVPTMFATLLQLDLAPFDLSSLRYMTNAAAALSPTHIRELRRRLPDVAIYSMYGMTETVRTLYLPPQWIDAKPASVGMAIPGTEVWLEDAEGQRLGPGAVGELVVRGRHVMRGYWDSPEATASRFRPGPLPGERLCYSGDLFRADADGCMYFVGRKDDIIKSRGEKIAPKEVEDILHELAGVAEAVVLGIPDPLLGQAVKAVVVRSDPELDVAVVLAHCKKYLEDLMIPKIVVFRETLPRSPSGKVRKEELI
jgi:long-chain acyl-CoA synthetase